MCKERPNKCKVDIYSDFHTARTISLVEKLGPEEIAEDLEPMEYDVVLGYSKHAIDKMMNTYGRQCEFEVVEELVKGKANEILEIKTDETFALLNKNGTLALICRLFKQNGELILSITTVIRNVIVDASYNEIEKKVWISRGTRIY